MEHWEEICVAKVPHGDYSVSLINGEEKGLSIKLHNKENVVSICFGAVSALRMMDEGVILDGVFNEEAILKFKRDKFSNTIYLVNGGEFESFIQNACNNLYDCLNLKHYVIITSNYIIEVIAGSAPEITEEARGTVLSS